MKTSGDLFIVAAPSGAGKTSLVSALLRHDAHIQLSISFTTRPPRPGEVDGVNYHFVDEPTFMKKLEAGDFLESARVHGNHYGTCSQQVNNALTAGQDVLLEIDWQGAEQVRRLFPQAISIFILPPSLEELKNRLETRAQDAQHIIERRIANAREEVAHISEFDYVIINCDFDEALRDLQSIVYAQRLKSQKQLQRHEVMVSSFI